MTSHRRTNPDGLDELNIQFHLEGLSPSIRNSYLDLYIPQLRNNASDPSDATRGPIQLLTTITTWKGITTQEAEELFSWEKCFTACLGDLLSMTVISEFRKSVQRQIVKWSPLTAGHWLSYFANKSGQKTIHVLLEDILSGMIDLYNDRIADAEQCSLALSGNLRGSLCNFLRTYDCFQDMTGVYAPVDVHLSAAFDEHCTLHLIGSIIWKRPDVSFQDFKQVSSPGSPYFLLPRYKEPLLNEIYPSAVTPEYQINSNHLPWQWNSGMQGFFCKTPANRNGKPSGRRLMYSKLESDFKTFSEIKAILITPFTGKMRFERVSRFKILTEIACEKTPRSIPPTKCSQPVEEHCANMSSSNSDRRPPVYDQHANGNWTLPYHNKSRLAYDFSKDSKQTWSHMPASWTSNDAGVMGVPNYNPSGSQVFLRPTVEDLFNNSGPQSPAEVRIGLTPDDQQSFLPSLSHIPATAMAKEHIKNILLETPNDPDAGWVVQKVKIPKRQQRKDMGASDKSAQTQSMPDKTEYIRKRAEAEEKRPEGLVQWMDGVLKSGNEERLDTIKQPTTMKMTPSSSSRRSVSEAGDNSDMGSVSSEPSGNLRVVNGSALEYDASDDSDSLPSEQPMKRVDSVIDGNAAFARPDNEKDSYHIFSLDGTLGVQEMKTPNSAKDRQSNAGLGIEAQQLEPEPSADQKVIQRYFNQCLAEKAEVTRIGSPSKERRDLDEEKVYESIFIEDCSGANTPILAAVDITEDSMLDSSEIFDVDIKADRE